MVSLYKVRIINPRELSSADGTLGIDGAVCTLDAHGSLGKGLRELKIGSDQHTVILGGFTDTTDEQLGLTVRIMPPPALLGASEFGSWKEPVPERKLTVGTKPVGALLKLTRFGNFGHVGIPAFGLQGLTALVLGKGAVLAKGLEVAPGGDAAMHKAALAWIGDWQARLQNVVIYQRKIAGTSTTTTAWGLTLPAFDVPLAI